MSSFARYQINLTPRYGVDYGVAANLPRPKTLRPVARNAHRVMIRDHHYFIYLQEMSFTDASGLSRLAAGSTPSVAFTRYQIAPTPLYAALIGMDRGRFLPPLRVWKSPLVAIHKFNRHAILWQDGVTAESGWKASGVSSVVFTGTITPRNQVVGDWLTGGQADLDWKAAPGGSAFHVGGQTTVVWVPLTRSEWDIDCLGAANFKGGVGTGAVGWIAAGDGDLDLEATVSSPAMRDWTPAGEGSLAWSISSGASQTGGDGVAPDAGVGNYMF